MLSLGPMDKGDYLCINLDQHSGYDKFDTENLMREHWLTCHKISLTDGFAAFVLPDHVTYLTLGRCLRVISDTRFPIL